MRYATHVLVLVSLLGLVGATQAAVEKAEISDLTAAAEQIVVGDVVDIVSFWEDGLIRSEITVAVDDYLRGNGNGVETFVISGGTVGDVSLVVSVLPEFQIGDHVLLFLGNNEIRLVESFQGAFLTDGADIVQMGPACVRMIGDTRQSLSNFLMAVEATLPAGEQLGAVSAYDGDFSLPIYIERYDLCGYDWTYKTNPMGESYKINANCGDSSAGDAESQRTQVWNGATQWDNAGADFTFTYGGTSTGTAVTYNSTNLIYWDTTPPDGGSYVAANYHWMSGGNMTESDLVFNDRDYTWWDGNTGSCSGDMDIWDISTHELGHTLCLADLYSAADSAKTMYGYVGTCEVKKRSLTDDDVAGIVGIYGSGSGGGYCDASGGTGYEYISNVELGSIDNASGDTGYSNYSAISTTMSPGDSATLTVTIDSQYSSDIGGCWVDWNQDYDFNDTGEEITTAWSGSGPTYVTTITVPSGAIAGAARLRVRMQDGDYDSTLDACGSVSYGEVEDYTIQIETNPCDYIEFTTQPTATQYVCEDNPVMLSVAVGGVASPTYQWRRGTTNLTNSSHIVGAQTSQLMIVDFQATDAAANYNCLVTNTYDGCQATSDNATLILDTSYPNIATDPQSQSIEEGNPALFSISVDVPSAYTYQWRLGGGNLSDDGRISGATTQSLFISATVMADAGDYDCVVTSVTGGQCSATSGAATLTVTPPSGNDCPEDLTGDDVISLADLQYLLGNYGRTNADPEDGDFDDDNDVDLTDLQQLLAVYGSSCPTR